MSLEQAIQDNTAAIRELIALQSGKATPASTEEKAAGGAKGTTAKTGTGAKGKAATKPKSEKTAEELKAKLVEYKKLTDLKTAKALTSKLGYDSITDVPDDEIDATYAAIEEAIENLSSTEETENGDDDL